METCADVLVIGQFWTLRKVYVLKMSWYLKMHLPSSLVGPRTVAGMEVPRPRLATKTLMSYKPAPELFSLKNTIHRKTSFSRLRF
jgi:hypothetical protein